MDSVKVTYNNNALCHSSLRGKLRIGFFVRIFVFVVPANSQCHMLTFCLCLFYFFGSLDNRFFVIVDEDDPNLLFSSLLNERGRTIKEQVKLQSQKARTTTSLIISSRVCENARVLGLTSMVFFAMSLTVNTLRYPPSDDNPVRTRSSCSIHRDLGSPPKEPSVQTEQTIRAGR